MWRHLNFFQYKASFGLTPVVPPKKNRTAPWDYDREAYKGRNMVEHAFSTA